MSIRQTIAGVSYEEQDLASGNWLLQVYCDENIKKCKDYGLQEVVNFDCIWSLTKISKTIFKAAHGEDFDQKEIQLSNGEDVSDGEDEELNSELDPPNENDNISNESKEEGDIVEVIKSMSVTNPVYCLTSVDKLLKPRIISFAIGGKENSTMIEQFIKGVAEHTKSNHKMSNFCPHAVIDDSKANIKAFNQLVENDLILSFSLCKFHVLRSWWKKLKTMRMSTEEQQELMAQLLLLASSKTDEVYNKIYEHVAVEYRDWCNNYFNEFYNSRRNLWTQIGKKNCYSCYNTNNLIERKFRSLRAFLRKKNFRVDYLLDRLLSWVLDEAYNERFEAKTAAVLVEAGKRFKVGTRLFNDKFVVPCVAKNHSAEDHHTLYFVTSEQDEKIRYRCCLRYMSCSCPDYIHHGRSCKHLYGACAFYINKFSLKPILPDNPFHVIQLVHVHVHYPNTYEQVYKDWNGLFPVTNTPLPNGRPVTKGPKASSRIPDFSNMIYEAQCTGVYTQGRDGMSVIKSVRVYYEGWEDADTTVTPYNSKAHAICVEGFFDKFVAFVKKTCVYVSQEQVIEPIVTSLSVSVEQDENVWFINDSVKFMPAHLGMVRNWIKENNLYVWK